MRNLMVVQQFKVVRHNQIFFFFFFIYMQPSTRKRPNAENTLRRLSRVRMSVSPRTQLLIFLISLSSRMGLSRYIEDNDASDGLYSLLSLDQKRESEDFIFRRPLRCLDMLATEGYFTFTASQPQLACAAFIIAEPSEVISLELSDVSIDCGAGDFIKMFDGWVLKGEKFPSRQDHPLPLHQRYTDYCSSTAPAVASRSSQNVAMVFFRIHSPDSGFTLAVKKLHNPFQSRGQLHHGDATPAQKLQLLHHLPRGDPTDRAQLGAGQEQ
ncbi:corticotropin-releasing factor-binding protein-like isoform 3-T4 [Acanthopagrus schlegelii]